MSEAQKEEFVLVLSVLETVKTSVGSMTNVSLLSAGGSQFGKLDEVPVDFRHIPATCGNKTEA